MIVACGFDHAGFPLRERLLPHIEELGHEVLDLGTDNGVPIDYPDKALEIGVAVVSGHAQRGIIVCGSGAGVSVAAGKIDGIRAATIHDTYTAHQAVEHDDVNVLCLGGRVIGPELAAEIVTAFLGAVVSGEERHRRRRAKIDEIERTHGRHRPAVMASRVGEPASLVVVRHGQTEWSAAGRHTGTTDIPLTVTGREEAAALAPRLGGEDYALVLCSPLIRARETCELAGFGAAAQPCPELVEWDYGDYDGLTTPQIREINPDWDLWHDGGPGGEAPAQVGARVDRVLERVAAVDGTVLAFAHGHVLRILTARWLEMEVAGGARFRLVPAGVGRLGWERETRVIEQWNA